MALTKLEPYMVDTTATFTFANTTIANVTATNITGNVSNVPIAVNVSANAQPNITSLGSLASLTVTGLATLGSTLEIINTKTGATGTVTHDLGSGSAFLHTSPAANFTPNFTNVAVTDNRATTVALLVVQGSTAYVPGNTINIDSMSYSVKWQANVKPAGTSNGTDIISYTIAKASGTYYIYGTSSSYS